MQSYLQHRSPKSAQRRGTATVRNLRAGASLLVLVAVGGAWPEAAWAAEGGYGGTNTGAISGTPGTDGDAASAHGGDAVPAATFSGGGGGGVDLTTGQGGTGGRRSTTGVLDTGTEGATGGLA